MPINNISLAVARHLDDRLLASWWCKRIEGAGFSSAVVWKIGIAGDNELPCYALKCAPIATIDRKRLEQIHRFHQCFACDSELPIARLETWAAGKTWIESDSCFWELTQWLPGRPISNLGAIDIVQLEQAMRTLARIHCCARSLGHAMNVSCGIQYRLMRLEHWKAVPLERLHAEVNVLVALNDPHDRSIVELYYGLAEDFVRKAQGFISQLQGWANASFPVQWIVRDLWREHVLFEDARVSGIIDLWATQYDWIGFDLARLLGSWFEPTDARYVQALDVYNAANAIVKLDHRFVLLIDKVSTYLSALQWLEWLRAGKFQLESADGRVAGRIRELILRAKSFDQIPAGNW